MHFCGSGALCIYSYLIHVGISTTLNPVRLFKKEKALPAEFANESTRIAILKKRRVLVCWKYHPIRENVRKSYHEKWKWKQKQMKNEQSRKMVGSFGWAESGYIYASSFFSGGTHSSAPKVICWIFRRLGRRAVRREGERTGDRRENGFWRGTTLSKLGRTCTPEKKTSSLKGEGGCIKNLTL